MSLPYCRTRTERQIAKYCPTRSLDRCTESVLIGRLLEVKGDSVKAFSFYTRRKYAEYSGADPEILERGGRKPNSRKGGPEYRLFSAAFSHSLINFLQVFQQKGGRGGRGPSGPSPKSAPEIAQLNICSIKNKIDEIRMLLQVCKFDILAITESHLDKSVENKQLYIDNYRLMRRDRINGKKGQGCIVYVANYLAAIQLRHLENPALEAIWIKLHTKITPAAIGLVY